MHDDWKLHSKRLKKSEQRQQLRKNKPILYDIHLNIKTIDALSYLIDFDVQTRVSDLII